MKTIHYFLLFLALPFILLLAYIWLVCAIELIFVWQVIIENGKPYLFKQEEITRYLVFFAVNIQIAKLIFNKKKD